MRLHKTKLHTWQIKTNLKGVKSSKLLSFTKDTLDQPQTCSGYLREKSSQLNYCTVLLFTQSHRRLSSSGISMGNTFIFDNKQQYDALEGGIAGTAALFLILPILGYSFLVYTLQKGCLIRNYGEFVHDCVSPFFTSLTMRGFKMNEDDYARRYKRVPLDVIQLPSKEEREVLHQKFHPKKPLKIRLVQNRRLSIGRTRSQIYAYFLLMAILICFWFICLIVDNTFYHKTTICDDMNPKDMSHVCFVVNESYRVANCSEDFDLPVICYIFNPSFLGLGLAFSVAKFLAVCTDAYYVFITKTTRCLPYHTGILRLVIAILSTAGFIGWWIGFGVGEGYTVRQDYFGFGRVPKRVCQSVLLLLTILVMTLCLPWNYSLDDECLYHGYRELVYKDDNEELLCTCCCGDRIEHTPYTKIMEMRDRGGKKGSSCKGDNFSPPTTEQA